MLLQRKPHLPPIETIGCASGAFASLLGLREHPLALTLTSECTGRALASFVARREAGNALKLGALLLVRIARSARVACGPFSRNIYCVGTGICNVSGTCTANGADLLMCSRTRRVRRS